MSDAHAIPKVQAPRISGLAGGMIGVMIGMFMAIVVAELHAVHESEQAKVFDIVCLNRSAQSPNERDSRHEYHIDLARLTAARTPYFAGRAMQTDVLAITSSSEHSINASIDGSANGNSAQLRVEIDRQSGMLTQGFYPKDGGRVEVYAVFDCRSQKPLF